MKTFTFLYDSKNVPFLTSQIEDKKSDSHQYDRIKIDISSMFYEGFILEI